MRAETNSERPFFLFEYFTSLNKSNKQLKNDQHGKETGKRESLLQPLAMGRSFLCVSPLLFRFPAVLLPLWVAFLSVLSLSLFRSQAE